jgi:hypothetical protein
MSSIFERLIGGAKDGGFHLGLLAATGIPTIIVGRLVVG